LFGTLLSFAASRQAASSSVQEGGNQTRISIPEQIMAAPNLDSAKDIMRKYVTAVAMEGTLVKKLNKIFNKIPVSHSFRQCGIKDDLVSFSLEISGQSLARGEIKRSRKQIADLVKFAETKKCADDVQVCQICMELVGEFVRMHRCKTHVYCVSCCADSHATSVSDYCGKCRAPIDF
jgi:hypothetical protein